MLLLASLEMSSGELCSLVEFRTVSSVFRQSVEGLMVALEEGTPTWGELVEKPRRAQRLALAA